LDLLVPNQGGLELLGAIRSDSRHKNTPVLILSNAYLPEMSHKALRAGGNKVLSKSECTSSELISVSCELAGFAAERGNGRSASLSREGRSVPTGIEGSTAVDLAEQLAKDLIEEGGAELTSVKQHCSKYVELVGSEGANEHFKKLYQSIRILSTRAGL